MNKKIGMLSTLDYCYLRNWTSLGVLFLMIQLGVFQLLVLLQVSNSMWVQSLYDFVVLISKDRNEDSGEETFIGPTPYPMRFQMSFVTNVTDHDTAYHYPIQGILYYDWSQMAQRIDHSAGSYECVRFYNVSSACSLLFLQEGMYRILPAIHNNNKKEHNIRDDCCLDLPNVGPPPPDWASKVPSTWGGFVWDDFSGVMAKEWRFDHLVDRNGSDFDIFDTTFSFHTMREVAFGPREGFPLVFTFPGNANGKQDMHYLIHTLNTSLPPNDKSLFVLSDGCRFQRCSYTHQSTSGL